MIVSLSRTGWNEYTVALTRVPGEPPSGSSILGVYEIGDAPCDGMMWKGPKSEPLERAMAFLATVVQSVIVGPDPHEVKAEDVGVPA